MNLLVNILQNENCRRVLGPLTFRGYKNIKPKNTRSRCRCHRHHMLPEEKVHLIPVEEWGCRSDVSRKGHKLWPSRSHGLEIVGHLEGNLR